MTKVPATESMTKPAERLDEAVQANTAFAVNELSASAIEALEAARMDASRQPQRFDVSADSRSIAVAKFQQSRCSTALR